MVMEYLRGLFGGGGGGPTPLTPQYAQGGGGLFSGGVGFNHPLVSAGLGFGGSVLNANAQGVPLGQALLAGAGGGAAGYTGAANAQQSQRQEEERAQQIRQILERMQQAQGGGGQYQMTRPQTTGGVFPPSTPTMDVRSPLYTGLF